jgi:hypothetical protein
MSDSTSSYTGISRFTLRAFWAIAAVFAAPAQAMDIAPGDYEVAPPGTTMALYYGQYSSSRMLRVDGKGSIADSKQDLQQHLLRFVRYGEIGGLPFAVQAIIPFGRFDSAKVGGIEQRATQGVGDVVIAASIFPVHAQNARDMTVGLSAFLALPTGAYAPDAFSIGSGTTTATVQLGVVRPLTARLSLDAAADASITADHSEAGVVYSQEPQAQAQAYLRFAMSPQTNLSVGFTGFFGGKRLADDVYQGLNAEGRQLRIFADTFITPTLHIQAMIGRDLSRSGGFEVDLIGQLRLLRIF